MFVVKSRTVVHDYGDRIEPKADLRNVGLDLFCHINEVGQMWQCEDDLIEECDVESLQKRGHNLSDKAFQISANALEREVFQVGKRHRSYLFTKQFPLSAGTGYGDGKPERQFLELGRDPRRATNNLGRK